MTGRPSPLKGIQTGRTSPNKGKIMSKEQYSKCKDTMFKKGITPANKISITIEMTEDIKKGMSRRKL